MDLLEFSEQLPLIALCTMRAFGITLILPIFSGSAIPSLAQSSIALIMSIPLIITHLHQDIASLPLDLTLLLFFLKEIVIGLLIGFIVAVPFWAVNFAGFTIDTTRGSSIASVLDPMSKMENSIFGSLFTYILTAIFFFSGAFHTMLSALYDTFTIIPIRQGIEFTNGIELLISQWNMMIELGLRFTLPTLVCMLMLDISLGLINRTTQQLNVFILSMPIKSIFILLVMLMSLSVSFSIFHQPFRQLSESIQTMVRHLK